MASDCSVASDSSSSDSSSESAGARRRGVSLALRSFPCPLLSVLRHAPCSAEHWREAVAVCDRAGFKTVEDFCEADVEEIRGFRDLEASCRHALARLPRLAGAREARRRKGGAIGRRYFSRRARHMFYCVTGVSHAGRGAARVAARVAVVFSFPRASAVRGRVQFWQVSRLLISSQVAVSLVRGATRRPSCTRFLS